MLAVAIELLAGRYVATAYNDRTSVEWPPHPARLFSALVATWAEEEPDSLAGNQERAALEWLEQQPPPDILADPRSLAGERTAVPVFVPVNDVAVVPTLDRTKLEETERLLADAQDENSKAKASAQLQKFAAKLLTDTAKAIAPPSKQGKVLRAGLSLLPEHRGKQERRFPCATPAHSKFAFVWSDAQPSPEVTRSIERLLVRLSRLGHSSSLVRAELATESILEELRTLVREYRVDPDRGDVVVRWVAEGQVNRLVNAFRLHKETEGRVLPARFVRYSDSVTPVKPELAKSLFASDFVVLGRVQGPRLPSTACAGIAKLLRRALMSAADQPVHEIISGHKPDGSATEMPHLAVVPLPLVGGPRPTGALLGIGLILPREATDEARRAVLRAVGRLQQPHSNNTIRLHLGAAGELQLERLAWGDSLVTLSADTWCKASPHWATATPIALDRNPGDLHSDNAAKRRKAYEEANELVIQGLQRIGLPSPEVVEVMRSCVLPGTAKPGSFPRFPAEAARPQRVLVHATFSFREPVLGPVLVGAGRYHGLGLCLPVSRGDGK